MTENERGRKKLKEVPVFDPHPSNVFEDTSSELSDGWINDLLACQIPAISTAMGRTTTMEGIRCVDMRDFKRGWGRNAQTYGERWLHCDIKDMAYFYTYPLWNEFVTIGNCAERKK